MTHKNRGLDFQILSLPKEDVLKIDATIASLNATPYLLQSLFLSFLKEKYIVCSKNTQDNDFYRVHFFDYAIRKHYETVNNQKLKFTSDSSIKPEKNHYYTDENGTEKLNYRLYITYMSRMTPSVENLGHLLNLVTSIGAVEERKTKKTLKYKIIDINKLGDFLTSRGVDLKSVDSVNTSSNPSSSRALSLGSEDTTTTSVSGNSTLVVCKRLRPEELTLPMQNQTVSFKKRAVEPEFSLDTILDSMDATAFSATSNTSTKSMLTVNKPQDVTHSGFFDMSSEENELGREINRLIKHAHNDSASYIPVIIAIAKHHIKHDFPRLTKEQGDLFYTVYTLLQKAALINKLDDKNEVWSLEIDLLLASAEFKEARNKKLIDEASERNERYKVLFKGKSTAEMFTETVKNYFGRYRIISGMDSAGLKAEIEKLTASITVKPVLATVQNPQSIVKR